MLQTCYPFSHSSWLTNCLTEYQVCGDAWEPCGYCPQTLHVNPDCLEQHVSSFLWRVSECEQHSAAIPMCTVGCIIVAIITGRDEVIVGRRCKIIEKLEAELHHSILTCRGNSKLFPSLEKQPPGLSARSSQLQPKHVAALTCDKLGVLGGGLKVDCCWVRELRFIFNARSEPRDVIFHLFFLTHERNLCDYLMAKMMIISVPIC